MTQQSLLEGGQDQNRSGLCRVSNGRAALQRQGPRGPRNEVRSRARHAPLVRCLKLVRILSGRRYMPDVGDIASELECSRRTVFRYLVALEEAGFPLPRRWKEEIH